MENRIEKLQQNSLAQAIVEEQTPLYKRSRRWILVPFSMGLTAGITGGLILGNILNIGLLSGVGGSILAGLTTIAACTGFGLIALSGLLLGASVYLFWKSFDVVRDLKRTPIEFSNIRDEKEVEVDAAPKFAAAPDVAAEQKVAAAPDVAADLEVAADLKFEDEQKREAKQNDQQVGVLPQSPAHLSAALDISSDVSTQSTTFFGSFKGFFSNTTSHVVSALGHGRDVVYNVGSSAISAGGQALKHGAVVAYKVGSGAISEGQKVAALASATKNIHRALKETAVATKVVINPGLTDFVPAISESASMFSNMAGFVLPGCNASDLDDNSPQINVAYFPLKGVLAQLSDAPRTFLLSGKIATVDPWLEKARVEAFKNGIKVIYSQAYAYIDNMPVIDDMNRQLSKNAADIIQGVFTGVVADGLEQVGHTRAAVLGGVGAVTSVLAQKNLNNWLSYLEKASVKNPSQRLSRMGAKLTQSLGLASNAYKASAVWQMMTFFQEAPPLFDSIQKLVHFINNPEAEQNRYFYTEIERIKRLIPQSQAWETKDFPSRLELYKELANPKGEYFLAKMIKEAAWDMFYKKAISSVDGIVAKAGGILSGALAGMTFRDLCSLDNTVNNARFSSWMGIEDEVTKCLVDTTGYFACNLGVEMMGAYIGSHLIKGITHQKLLAQKHNFLAKIEATVTQFLRENVLFNPQELPFLDHFTKNTPLLDEQIEPARFLTETFEKDRSSANKVATAMLPHLITAAQFVFTVSKKKQEEASGFKRIGNTIESLAENYPSHVMVSFGMAGCGLGLLKINSVIDVAYSAQDLAYKAIEDAKEHPYLAASAVVGLTTITGALCYAPKLRGGVANYVVNPVLKATNYLWHSPALVATLGFGVSVAMDDPLLAVCFAAPAISNVYRTSAAGFFKATSKIGGFFSRKAVEVEDHHSAKIEYLEVQESINDFNVSNS